jgi:23S rRNA pseudoU1915 N3-methylase RlmH
MAKVNYLTVVDVPLQEVIQNFTLEVTGEEFIAIGAALDAYKRNGSQEKVKEIARELEAELREVKRKSHDDRKEKLRRMEIEREREERRKRELKELADKLTGEDLIAVLRKAKVLDGFKGRRRNRVEF